MQNNFTLTMLTAHNNGLKCIGSRSGLLYFNDRSGSTLAIETDNITPANLMLTLYRMQYNGEK